MKKSEWSDRELEELLRHMPKIVDHRNPRDIYQNLSRKMRKPFPWLLPGLAAACALVLSLILVPKYTDGFLFIHDHAAEQKSTVEKGLTLTKEPLDSDLTVKNTDTQNGKLLSSSEQSTAKASLYEDEVGNGKVLTFWIPDPQAQILIPVSTVVHNNSGKSWVDLFKEKMASLKEKEWGLSDCYPLKATIKLDQHNQKVLVDLPVNHQYGQGAAGETSFINIIKKDVSSNSNIKKISLSTNKQPGIELGNYGTINNLDVTHDHNHAYYLYYANDRGLPFLTPSVKPFKDINAALSAMRSDQPNLGLKKSLIPEIKIKHAEIKDKTLVVTLDAKSHPRNDQLNSLAFEAVLLTAKDFGLEKVLVTNPPISRIGAFDLSKENKVPLAPNLRTLD